MTVQFRTDESATRATREARVVLSSAGRGWRGLEAEFLHIPRGATHVPAAPTHRLGIHFGRAVNADCRCDGRRHRRVQAHGDIDIIPAGLDGVWEDDADCTILRLRVTPELVASAVADLRADALVAPRFQLRDPRIEAVAWAIKAELEAEAQSDRLYAESLGLALASRMLQAGDRSPGAEIGRERMLTPLQRRRIVDYIEARLDNSLSLLDLADVAGLGVSQFKTLFRRSFGLPAHQYVLRRRVERARLLLIGSDLPMSRIAAEVGFADQSHMTKHVQRLLGQTPRAIARARG